MAALNMTTLMTPYQDSSRENGAKALTVLVCRVGTTPSCCKQAITRSEEHTSELQSPDQHSFPTRRSSDLAKRPDGKVRLAWQRSNSINPNELADHGSVEYDNADDAVSGFIQREWSKGIDGISLSRRHDT